MAGQRAGAESAARGSAWVKKGDGDEEEAEVEVEGKVHDDSSLSASTFTTSRGASSSDSTALLTAEPSQAGRCWWCCPGEESLGERGERGGGGEGERRRRCRFCAAVAGGDELVESSKAEAAETADCDAR